MGKNVRKPAVDVTKVETPALPVLATLLSVADAKAGRVADVDAFIGKAREYVALGSEVASMAALESAKGHWAIVRTGGTMRQGDYVAALGYTKQYGTVLARLGVAVVGLGIGFQSAEYRYVMQRGSNGETAWLGKLSEDDLKNAAARKPHLDRLKGEAAEYAEHGKVTKSARTPQTAGDGTESGESESTESAPVTRESVTAALTAHDLVALLSVAVKGLDGEEWAKVESDLDAIRTREVTLRTKAAADAAKADRATKRTRKAA